MVVEEREIEEEIISFFARPSMFLDLSKNVKIGVPSQKGIGKSWKLVSL